MFTAKTFRRDLKFFIRIFLIIFIVLFVVFNGTAFGAIVIYRIRYFADVLKKTLQEEIAKPLVLPDFTTPATFLVPEKDGLIVIAPAVPPEAQTANILELPKFGITAPIWKIDASDSKLIYAKLKQGVVLYPGSAIPGQGYSIIIGHSSQYPWQPGKYKTVFSLLSELRAGDRIHVYWDQQPLVFEVQDTKIFLPWPKGSEITETVFPPEDKPILILQSCWPAGVAFKRVAVKTVLLK